MRRKLFVTIALGAALAVIAAGTATSVTVDPGNVKVDVPNTGPLPACSDLADNDGDGLVDMSDPGCSSPLDTDEYNAPSSGGSGGGGGGIGGTGIGGTGSGGTTGS